MLYLFLLLCLCVIAFKKFVLSLSFSSLNIKHFKFWFVISMTRGSLRVQKTATISLNVSSLFSFSSFLGLPIICVFGIALQHLNTVFCFYPILYFLFFFQFVTYWTIFMFTDSFLSCIESAEEPVASIFLFYSFLQFPPLLKFLICYICHPYFLLTY